MVDSTRTLVLTVPDWPALAAVLSANAAGTHIGTKTIGPDKPVMVLTRGTVTAANHAARAYGVVLGMNKRAAQLRCPQAVTYPHDPERDHRAFAAAIDVLDDAVARFSLFRPGTVTIPLASLARTYTHEVDAVEHLLTALTDATGWEVFAGVADTPFAALLAARGQTRVPPGDTPQFLARFPVDDLNLVDEQFLPLTVLLHRLGIDRLGQLATLGRPSVYARFGDTGVRAWLLAAGQIYELTHEHIRARDFTVFWPLDPPSHRTDVITFAARAAAVQFLTRIRAQGLICTHVRVTLHAGAHTYARTWHIDALTESALADRVRWQAAGWQPETPDEDTDGVHALELQAEELCTPLDGQPNLFTPHTEDVTAALERLQGLFGADAVTVPVLQGGRSPEETNLWTPWRMRIPPHRRAQAPWPGAIPAPRPTVVENTPVDVLDEFGRSVVARPTGLDSVPRTMTTSTETFTIVNFSSVWPVDAFWWDEHQYRVRCQVVTDTRDAFLLCKESGQWSIVGRYT